MNIDDVKRINSLWRNIYPYLASQIMEIYRKDCGSVLELGPFSGGISNELAKLYPKLTVTIAAESSAAVEYLRQEIEASGLSNNIRIKKTNLDRLIFNDSQFDLVIFRGAFFFLDNKKNLLQEISRVLKQGAIAFIGGGYGKDTPKKLIDEISSESRKLNDRLGRRRIRVKELEKIIRRSNLTDNCSLEEQGGLWLKIRK